MKPELRNDTEKTLIQTVSKSKSTPNNSYIIISSQGTTIIADPTEMPSLEELDLHPEAIIVTHPHKDHLDPSFMERCRCQKSVATVENFKVDDVYIYSLASSHRGDTINKKNPDNVIYVIEMDKLRIAHLGDIGQNSFTLGQLESLQNIDIVFMQFSNPFSGITPEKSMRLAEQLKPHIIIPTHSNPRSTYKMGKFVGKLEEVENILDVNRKDIGKEVHKVVYLKNTLQY